jgi:drug/metabolite transporter (DMT)-like permease
MPLLGETAALIVAILWTANSILFSAAGRRIGAISVNAFRIIVALLFLSIAHIIFFGTIFPDANQAQWFWMGVSGIVGLGIGDFALFSAFVMIGPRRALLLIWAGIGIVITLSGIIIVVLEREKGTNERTLLNGQKKYGILLGIVGGVGQGVGLVISKYGMVTVADDPSVPLDSLSAALIRMLVGAIFIWICVIAMGKLKEMKKSLSDKHALKLTSGGAFLGPFLGVWLSMVAVTYTQAGIAMTLMSLMPVIIIPTVWILYREKTNWRGVLGAVVAVVGVAILFLV